MVSSFVTVLHFRPLLKKMVQAAIFVMYRIMTGESFPHLSEGVVYPTGQTYDNIVRERSRSLHQDAKDRSVYTCVVLVVRRVFCWLCDTLYSFINLLFPCRCLQSIRHLPQGLDR